MNNIKLIKHRLNKITDLDNLPSHIGAEIDLRSDINNLGEIHLSHDAWVKGDSFNDWLDVYSKKSFQGPLILNTKEDGLEERILSLLNSHHIKNFFFLDTTLPTLIKWGKTHKAHMCVRFSKFESLDYVIGLRDYADWVWVDCFNTDPVDVNSIKLLKQSGFKTCLVAPELQGGSMSDLAKFDDLMSYCDYMCTKFIKEISK